MKVALVIASNDSESVWNAIRFANTALAHDDEVSVFLLGKGVEAPLVSTLQYDVEEQLDLFRNSGGHLIGCGVCCQSRKDEMPQLVDKLRCEIGSMQRLHEIVAKADKVLNF